MKTRLYILTTTFIAMIIMLFISFFVDSQAYFRIALAVQLVISTFILIYIFGGIGKLVSSIIYGTGIALLLVLLPKYDTAFIFIGTFIFLLNPLGDFEQKIDQRFPEEKSILSQLRGSYSPYYEYRKETKNYYHLPQTRKAFNKPSYLKVRQGLTILLSTFAVFLLIREVNNLINLLKNFQIHLFFASTYSVIILVVITIILYRKGFQSMLNFLTVSLFPPVAYSLYVVVTPTYLAVILGSLVIVIGIITGIYQYLAYRSRIVYEYYYYYDNDFQAEIYANALYEPFVYNEAYHLTVIYELDITKSNFEKIFHSIVTYADIHRFYITAYSNNNKVIKLFTEFHYGSEKRISKFSKYLENLTQERVYSELIIDKEKSYYENNFFHKTDYIVARTNYLATLLKKLEIKSNVIVSFILYFQTIEDIEKMSINHSITRLYELDLEGVYTVRIDFKAINNPHIIESKVRELLLDLLIYRGKYVRVSVYY